MFERINSWLLRRLPSRRSSIEVTATPAGLQTRGRDGAETIAWERIVEVVAARGEQVVGNTLMLVFGLDDGRALTVTEDTAAWTEIAKALPSHLPSAVPYEQWSLEVAFSSLSPTKLVVFRR